MCEYRWQLSSFSRISYVVRRTLDHGAYPNNDFVDSAKTPRELIDIEIFINEIKVTKSLDLQFNLNIRETVHYFKQIGPFSTHVYR